MERCAHKGCGQDFDPATNSEESCVYHPGAPVFHEGLKSWSCCNTVNKPVLEFDQFMSITGCTRGPHSAAPPKPDPPKEGSRPAPSLSMSETHDGKEVYTSHAAVKHVAPAAPMTSAPPTIVEEEEEDLDALVPPGTTCRHKGCDVAFQSDEENRKGDGAGTVCTYHPAAPIFHEGSKVCRLFARVDSPVVCQGYLCCKRRVLEFDEFLKIEGCTKGRHLFVPKATKDPLVEELVNCRIDHYQTPSSVQVTVYAKQADKERSTVTFAETQLYLDLFLPGPKRFTRTIELFGPIDSDASSFKYYGTKVDVTLKKLDGRSWTLLEKTDRDLGNIALTFGVGGRTGTIGAKQAVLDNQNGRKAA
ncbi:HSP20-like chaperone [Amylostereum chailletii]|nr:HSP20-like chaperone [Amylostereum chailletii]